MKKEGKLKIALVGDSLSNGGAERVQARLSFFFEKNKIEIHHIIVTDQISFDYAGKLFNLGLEKNANNGWINKVKRLVLLRKYIRKNQFDFIIDFRSRHKKTQEYLISRFLFSKGYIPTVHSYNTEWYALSGGYLPQKIYQHTHTIVSVSKGIEKKIYDLYSFPNLKTIYNPIDLNAIAEKAKEKNPYSHKKYIVAMGRMDDTVKQFDRLIQSYFKTTLPSLDIHLLLIGDGIYRSELEALSQSFGNTEKILFTGTLHNPFPVIAGALFTVLSSKNEGLPYVLIESLACETPVVSFDCLSGPNEIVKHQKNGLLVPDQNFDSLIEHINKMATDTALYFECKKAAKSSVENFDIDIIGKQWLKLLRK